jgi:hypothetical protein
MFKIIGGAVVYGFALYGLLRFTQGRHAPSDED